MYSENDYRLYLEHHGIPGQKWGVKNGPPYPLRNKYSAWYANNGYLAEDRLSKATISNFDKWGSSSDTNTLYVTGISGSGKSTVAGYLADENDADVINLDSYLSPMGKTDKQQIQSKGFNKYLDKNVPDWQDAVVDRKTLNWDIVDNIARATEGYSKALYKNGKKLIVEGVQIQDETLFVDRERAYSGKPMIVLNTGKEESDKYASERDKGR